MLFVVIAITTELLCATAAVTDILKIMIMVTMVQLYAGTAMKMNITAAKDATGLSMTMTLTGTATIHIVNTVTMIQQFPSFREIKK